MLRSVFSTAALLVCLAQPAAAFLNLAPCDIAIPIRAAGVPGNDIAIQTGDVRVRSVTSIGRFGAWRRATEGGWFDDRATLLVTGGETVRDVYRASRAMQCDVTREIEVPYTCLGGPHRGSRFVARAEFGIWMDMFVLRLVDCATP